MFQVSRLLKRDGDEFEYLKYQERILDFYKSKFEFEARDCLCELLLTTNFWNYYTYKPDLLNAEKYYQKAQDILEKMKNLNADNLYQAAKAQVTFAFVQHLQVQSQFTKMIEILEDFIADYNKYTSKDSMIYTEHICMQAMEILASTYCNNQQYDKAIEICESIINNISPNYEEVEEQTFNNILLDIYHIMAGCYLKLGDDKKKDFYNKLASKFAEITKTEAKELYYTGEGDFTYITGVRHVGRLENGFRQGYGESYLLNGDKYVGNFLNDEISGMGKYIQANGSYYVGEWKHNKPDGLGKYCEVNVGTYEGRFVNGKREGFGKFYNVLGYKYEGDWKDDKMNGYGEFTDPNGEVYQGDWKDGFMEGRGKYFWPDGDCYEGEFKNSEMSGYGVFTYNNGARYEGQFLNDVRHGKGVFTYKDCVYEGDFIEGEWTGYGVLTFADGTKYEGDFVEGKFEGKGTFYDEGTLAYQGEFKNDLRHGYGKEFDKDGKVVYDGKWENDEKVD